jgi:hypothetical protein
MTKNIEISPEMFVALADLAKADGQTVDALVAALVNEALSCRLRRPMSK